MNSRQIFKVIPVLILIGFLLSNFSLAQQMSQPPKAPETLEQAKTMGEKVLTGLPRALIQPWQDALRIWSRMFNIFSGWWDSYILPWLKNIWYKISVPFKTEMERKKPIIEEEFEKEKTQMKEEIKTEIPKTTKSLWERFKELLK